MLTDERARDFFEVYADSASVDHACRNLNASGVPIRPHDVHHWVAEDAKFFAPGDGGTEEEFSFAEVYCDLRRDKVEWLHAEKIDIARKLFEGAWEERDPEAAPIWNARSKAAQIYLRELEHQAQRGALDVDTWNALRGGTAVPTVWMPQPVGYSLSEMTAQEYSSEDE